jgi:ABC-type bacteriocin/lantibiotic exporter with double-glycine peptidase domain
VRFGALVMKNLLIKYSRQIIYLAFISLIFSIINSTFGIIVKLIIDRQFNISTSVALVFCGVFIAQRATLPLLTGVLAFLANDLSCKVENEIKRALHHHIVNRDSSEAKKENSGEIQKRLFESIASTRAICNNALRTVLATTTECLSVFVIASFVVDVKAGLILLAAGILYAAFSITSFSSKRELITGIRDSDEKINGFLSDELYAKTLSDQNTRTRKKKLTGLIELNKFWQHRNRIFLVWTNTKIAAANFVVCSVVMLITANLWSQQTGTLVYVATSLAILLFQINQFSMGFQSVLHAKIDFKNISRFLEHTATKTTDRFLEEILPPAEYCIKINAAEVHRTAPVESLTINLELKLKLGCLTLLSGPNGVGKSTIAKIISGSIRSTEDKVTFNNLSRKEAALDNFITLVYQDDEFSNSTVLENLLNDHFQPTHLEIEKTFDLLGLSYLLASNYKSIAIGENGSLLSGGERKRLSIARAWLTRPKLMILDEPFAGIDEINIQRLYNSLCVISKTTHLIIVSHIPIKFPGIFQFGYLINQVNHHVTASGDVPL